MSLIIYRCQDCGESFTDGNKWHHHLNKTKKNGYCTKEPDNISKAPVAERKKKCNNKDMKKITEDDVDHWT